jgi:hypothetical protein
MTILRPAYAACGLFCALIFFAAFLYGDAAEGRRAWDKQLVVLQHVVSDLRLSDLALSTEARYTRHPAISDSAVIGMDHPGGLDHFPSTLAFAPPLR